VFAITATGPIGEYFANGILVKNCDSSLYSWRAAQPYLSTEEEPKLKRGTEAFIKDQEQKMIERLALPPDAWWDTREDFNNAD
jgi:hypothetical protein